MTGAGAMFPAIADGELGPLAPPFPAPVEPISITIDNAPATIVFVAQAPGKIAGVVRLDLVVPAGTAAGAALLRMAVGGTLPPANTAQPPTTIAVQ